MKFHKRNPSSFRCEYCGKSLKTVKDIGYVRIGNGIRVYECRKCHRKKTHWKGRRKRLKDDWLVIA